LIERHGHSKEASQMCNLYSITIGRHPIATAQGSDAWIIDVRTLRTVTVCGLSKLPVKLSSESRLLPMSAIAPQDISGSSHSVAFGSVIPDANGHVPMEWASRRGTGCFQRVAHHRT
jgi:hypothetical protein